MRWLIALAALGGLACANDPPEPRSPSPSNVSRGDVELRESLALLVVLGAGCGPTRPPAGQPCEFATVIPSGPTTRDTCKCDGVERSPTEDEKSRFNRGGQVVGTMCEGTVRERTHDSSSH